MRQRFVRSLAAAGATAALMAAGIGAASAHVHVHPDSTEAGESALLTFEMSHGCSGSPTTAITVTLPEQITDATPTAHPGWTTSKVVEEFPEPRVLANGTSIGSRTSQVVFTALEPLPDGVRDTFQLTVRLPDAPGETLAFPVLQSCTEGETDWAQLPAEGQSEDDLDSPAPVFTISEERRCRHRFPFRHRLPFRRRHGSCGAFCTRVRQPGGQRRGQPGGQRRGQPGGRREQGSGRRRGGSSRDRRLFRACRRHSRVGSRGSGAVPDTQSVTVAVSFSDAPGGPH